MFTVTLANVETKKTTHSKVKCDQDGKDKMADYDSCSQPQICWDKAYLSWKRREKKRDERRRVLKK